MRQTKPVSRKAEKPVEQEMTGRDFDALPAAEKQRIFDEIERGTPEQRRAESRPLSAAERARWKRIKKKMGRPRVGKGIRIISLSVEQGLLERADAYAAAHGISRAQVIARGLLGLLGDDRPAKAG